MYKLTEEEQGLVNEVFQLEREAEVHYLYSYDLTKNIGLFNAAEFFRRESEEEKEHGQILRDFLTDWNCMPIYKDLVPVSKADNLPSIIALSYEMEYALCEKYKEVAEKAFSMNQDLYKLFLKFVKIQHKAVAQYSDFMNQLEFIKTPFEVFYFDNTVFAEKIK